MDHEFLSVPDMLAVITAQLDQVQSQINDARFADMANQEYQLELDRKQRELDEKRKRVSIMRKIAALVYP